MTDADFLLTAQLLPPEFDQLGTTLSAELAQPGAGSLPARTLNLLGSEASGAIRQSLDLNVFELLAQGWSTARELREYTQSELHPPLERSVLFLGEHTLTTTAYPVLTVRIGPVSYPALRLNLELKANFRAAALTIQNGHILSVQSGDCSVSAQLSCGDTPLHKQLESKHLTLPGKLEFKAPGIAIQRASSPPPATH